MPPKRRPTTAALSESIGHRLARLRHEQGITQIELARRLGISQANVSDYERGTLRLNSDLIVELTRILRVSADDLLGLNPPPRHAQVKDRRLLHRLALIDQLPKREKDALVLTIKAFLRRREVTVESGS